MSEDTAMLADATRRLFERFAPQADRAATNETEWAGALWAAFCEAGLAHPATDAEFGGAGGTAADERVVVDLSGYFALPVPLAETMLAGRVLAAAGLTLPEGGIALGYGASNQPIQATATDRGWCLAGRAVRIAWSDLAATLVVLAEAGEGELKVCMIPAQAFAPLAGSNLAGESRVDLSLDNVLVPDGSVATSGLTLQQIMAHGALLRGAQIAGGIDRILEYSIAHVSARQQFGRTLSKFQAVQQQLAVLAEEMAAARGAVAAAYDKCDTEGFVLAAAVAKARAGEAARKASAIAHQVHGAIGFAHEYPLHFNTTRLMSWRSEFGNEHHWYRLIGQMVAGAGGDHLWSLMAD